MHTPITRSELARSIGVDRVTLWRWEAAGLIPPADTSGRRRPLYSPAAQLAIRAFVGGAR